MSGTNLALDRNDMRDAHLNDADLVRHLDGEGGPPERAGWEAHLRRCPACAGRLGRLEWQSGVVRAWLVRADHEPRPASPPAPRRRPAIGPWLRAAVIVLLLAAPLAAVPPVRQWVAEQIGLAAPPEQESATATAVAAPVDAPRIRFTPAPGTFTVRLAAPGPGSTLELRRSDGPEAVLEGAGGDEAPVVYDDGLGLPATPDRRYRLALPASVQDVVLVVGGRAIPVPGSAIDAGRVLDLAVNR